jgi:hypothetical protein
MEVIVDPNNDWAFPEHWPEPDPEPEPQPRNRSVATRVLQFVVVGLIALLGVATIGVGRTDSAMVFIGLPTLMALAIALSPPAKSVHGMTFKGVTLGLLVAGVLAHEGIICIVMAAPLVYGVAHAIAAVANRHDTRTYIAVPFALMLGLEGFVPGLRVDPRQTVTVTHTVALAPAVVADRIAAGPDFASVKPSPLLAMVPLPGHVTGRGLAVGDGWDLVFHGDKHGPGGELLVRVDASQRGPTAGRVEFAVVSDTSVVHRWLSWTGAELTWTQVPTGTAVTLTMHFTRALDPSWYFGPLEQVMVRAEADVFLDALGLPDA